MKNIEQLSSKIQNNNEIESLTPIEKLLYYQKKGYFFHGSTNPNIDKLEPKPAIDTDKTKEFNNDTAVFASPIPSASIIFACMSLDNVPSQSRNGTWSVDYEADNGIVATIPRRWASHIKNNSGYVYVLSSLSFPTESFTNGSWQVKSKQSVKPLDIVKVSFDDFNRLGGKIIWED
jgi:hypothetical protein